MSYQFEEYPPAEQPPEKPETSPLKAAVYLVIVILLIAGLMGSAIGGVVWLINRDRTETAFSLPPTAIPRVEEAASATDTPETAVASPTPLPEPTPFAGERVNRIVFINEDGQVETISPGGTDQRQIGNADNLVFQFPAWSPASDAIAAVGGGRRGGGVFLLTDEAKSDAPQELYFDRRQSPFYLYWSPDGRMISFLASHPELEMGLHTVDAVGDAGERLLATGSPFYWNWTAESDQIFIHTGATGADARLTFLDAGSNAIGQNIAAPGLFQAPGISPDGRFLAYAEEDGNGLSWLVAADTSGGKVHRERHAGLVAMSWSPVANHLAFISSGDDSMQFFGPLRMLDADTGQVRLLSQDTVLAFFWSPDGRYLATITTDSRNDGTIARHKPLRSSKQTRSIFLDLVLIDVQSGEGRHLLTFQPTFLFLTQYLPFFDQYGLSHRLWSPDSDALVLPIQEEGEDQIVIVPTSGGRMRPLAAGNMPSWSQN